MAGKLHINETTINKLFSSKRFVKQMKRHADVRQVMGTTPDGVPEIDARIMVLAFFDAVQGLRGRELSVFRDAA